MKIYPSSLSMEQLKVFGVKSPHSLGSDFYILNRVPYTASIANFPPGQVIPIGYSEPSAAGDERLFAVVDLETTGFEHDSEIIEIGLLRGTYSPSEGRITSIDSVCSMLQEPSKPLRPIITEVTGLTDEALAGQRICEDRVAGMLDGVELLIAHNAKFDRRFFDKRFPQFANKTWACSSKGGDIDWKAAGHRSSALESLLLDYGYFYDAHRASIDCMATAWLLLVADGKFGELISSVESSLYLVEALGAPYDVKDNLKGAGFIWNGDDKIWHTSVKGDAALQDLAQFLSRLYPSARESMRIVEVPTNLRHANIDLNTLPR